MNFENIKKEIEKQFYYKDLNDFSNIYNSENCFFIDKIKIENSLIECFKYLIDNLKDLNDFYNYFVMDNNKKIKKDQETKYNIFGFSIKPYVLCNNMLNGSCKISKVCYASKNELQFKIDSDNKKRYYSLEKTLKNYIFYYFLIFANDKENNYKLLKNTLNYHSKELKKYNIIRFNIKSDFIDQKHLNFSNDLFKLLESEFNYKFAYGYTKTKGLNFDNLEPNFIINESIIIENESDLKYIDPNKYQFITFLNKELIINSIPKCKNQTIKINCNICTQCFKIKNKRNDKH